MRSVWVITEDLLFDPEDGFESSEGVAGPFGVTDADVAQCLSKGEPFELFDDDGEIYYRGKVLGDLMRPLWDYGMPNAGCTRIKVNGEEV